MASKRKFSSKFPLKERQFPSLLIRIAYPEPVFKWLISAEKQAGGFRNRSPCFACPGNSPWASAIQLSPGLGGEQAGPPAGAPIGPAPSLGLGWSGQLGWRQGGWLAWEQTLSQDDRVLQGPPHPSCATPGALPVLRGPGLWPCQGLPCSFTRTSSSVILEQRHMGGLDTACVPLGGT